MYSLPRGSQGWERSWNERMGWEMKPPGLAGSYQLLDVHLVLCLFQSVVPQPLQLPLPPDPFQLGWTWIIYSTSHAGNTCGDQQKPRLLQQSGQVLVVKQPGSGLGVMDHPSQPLPQPAMSPALPIPPEKSAGTMSRMGFSSSQENQKHWKMPLLPMHLPGILGVICSYLLNGFKLQRRSDIDGGKEIKLLIMLKTASTTKK